MEIAWGIRQSIAASAEPRSFNLTLMNAWRAIKWIFIASFLGLIGVAILFLVNWPKTRALPEGYTDVYFPRTGQRFLVDSEGIKRVGPEILDYQVSGTIVTGHETATQPFQIDLKTNKVILGTGTEKAEQQAAVKAFKEKYNIRE